MSEEIKNSELGEEVKAEKKPFSVNISEEDFAAEDIPAPESDAPKGEKPHKVVRYVDAPKEEKPKAEKKKKAGFFAGVAAGMKTVSEGVKTVGEGISAGAKVVAEKAPVAKKEEAPKAKKAEAPKAEAPAPVKEAPKAAPAPKKEAPKAKTPVEDETQFPTDDKKPKAEKAPFVAGLMAKLNALPTGAIIGGAVGLIVVLVAIILIIATSCSPDSNTPSDNSGSESQSNGVVIGPSGDTSSEPEEEGPAEVPTRKEQFVEAYNTNNDVMGWLYIPGLEDVDAGFCFSTSKNYPYNKRDITGKKVSDSYWITGAYYSHYRNAKGATAAELSTNTVIFGHSDLGVTNLAYSNDDPTGPLFSQLFNFKDPSFAEKTPYVYVTLPEEDTVWEIFAVFYNDAKATEKIFSPYYKSGAGDLWYIEPAPDTDEYELMLKTVQERSLYDYDVEVTKEDKILTLSTCTVGYGLKGRDAYRFVIVAKLVKDPATEHVAKNASFTINADAPIPSSYKEEFTKYAAEWKPAAQQ